MASGGRESAENWGWLRLGAANEGSADRCHAHSSSVKRVAPEPLLRGLRKAQCGRQGATGIAHRRIRRTRPSLRSGRGADEWVRPYTDGCVRTTGMGRLGGCRRRLGGRDAVVEMEELFDPRDLHGAADSCPDSNQRQAAFVFGVSDVSAHQHSDAG